MTEKERRKLGRNVLARGMVICFMTAIISSLAISGLPAQQTEDTVTVTVAVNAPARVKVGVTFSATIDVTNLTNFNSGQFELSFDSSVVNVTEVAGGSIDGTAIPESTWELLDANTVGVLVSMPMGDGVNGSGYIATISFDVLGEAGDRSELSISAGRLADKDAENITAVWIGDEVTIGPIPVTVTVNAPEMVKGGVTFNATIDVTNITNFNSGQFELSFDSHVVNVTEVAGGSIDGTAIPESTWELLDANTVGVLVSMPMGEGVNGSGYIATISFEAVGEAGDRSELSISEGWLADKDAENITAEWIDDEVTIGPIPVTVTVNAPAMVKEGDTFNATIDITNLTNFNSGQFELSFDSSVVNVTEVAGGSIEGTAIPESTWELLDANTVGVLVSMPMGEGVNGSGYIATISFEAVGKAGDRSELSISEGRLADKDAENITAVWIGAEVIVVSLIIDTGPGTYPSISGRHEGTIEVYEDVTVEKVYTYHCIGTGGHAEHVKIWNDTWSTEAAWSGYTGDWNNISFSEPFVLYAGEPYSYIIETGSYPQIIHKQNHTALYDRGIISCDKFVDANGRIYNDWIPAIKLW